MKIVLNKKPKSPVIVEGFPGFGLVGTITTEYLVNELKAELIGYIQADDIPPMVAIHENKVIQPIGIYYDESKNLVLLHVMTNVRGIEWGLGEMIVELAKQLDAKDIISIEGVGTSTPTPEVKAYSYCNNKNKKKFADIGVEPLKEGIILGVTGTLLLLAEKEHLSSIFVETHSTMPDSKAAAKAVEILDKYLGLNIPTEPLLKQAEKFESKIKGVMEQGAVASEEQKKKTLNYVG